MNIFNNLENKIIFRFLFFSLNVIRRRYSLQEVPWRGIHNAIATAMSICVAMGNKVLDTCLPQPVGCGGKYDVESSVQCGRSMIEMLGVLAIIAVLSVGGIAGYSKAMERFKVNKLIQEYNDLIFGLLEYRQSLQENIKGETHLTNSIMALNLVPSTWIKLNDMYLQDSLGNWVNIRYRQTNNSYSDIEKEGVIIDFNLGGLNIDSSGNRSSDNFNEKICFEMLNNIVQPLHQTLYGLLMVGGSGRYFGDTYCQNNQSCLKNMTLAQMQQVCKSCNRSNRCNVTIIF